MKMRSPMCALAVLLCLSVFLFTPPLALAHRVLLFAWVEKGMVNVEGGFGGKKAAKSCMIKAFDDKQNLVFSGKTDDDGRCSFKVPDGHRGEMALELEAGPGHKGLWTIAAEEFEASSATPAQEVAAGHQALEEGADPMKILAGIAVIFGLALAAGLMKKKRNGGARA